MNKEILIDYFQKVLPMPSVKAELIANTFTYKEVSKNTFLIEEGKICNISHFIEEGCARLYTFEKKIRHDKVLLIGNSGIPWQDFLKSDVNMLFEM